MRIWTLVLVVFAGLLGAAGVAAAAAAAHMAAAAGMSAIAQIGLSQAAALCGLAALAMRWRRPAWALAAAGVIAGGAGLFCGELALRHFAAASLFPMAAPTGGGLVILGWLMVCAAAVRELFAPEN